jgi:hypothetical protein
MARPCTISVSLVPSGPVVASQYASAVRRRSTLAVQSTISPPSVGTP